MTVIEENARLALWIAKFLDVELDPWHRQPAPMSPEEMSYQRALLPDPSLCGAVYDNSDPGNIIWCTLSLHHRVLHLAFNGTSWADE